jgi:RNA polymerase sigma factor (sigma-70 family)
LWTRRLLALASDGALVEEIRRGNEAAFSVAFERHAAGLLRFCRHMVGSPEDAEDAVQHTFVAAFRHLARPAERELALKPWLYAIARNRCLSVLRSRSEQTALDVDIPTEGLAEQVERRAELLDLLRDLRELPHDQRAALLLSEAGDLTHAEVAGVLGCDVANVKALVFRARDGLIQRRNARETQCADIREQLANLRGNSLRRSALRHHLRSCAGCRAYREQLKRQRRMHAAALPVVPSPGLKSSALAAAGLGEKSLGAGVGAGLSASLGAGTLVKVAAVGLLVAGATSGEVLVADAERLLAPSPKAAAHGPDSSRQKPSAAPVVAGRPIANSVRQVEPRAAEDRSDTRAQEQRSDGAPPSAARPDGDRGPPQEQDATTAPSADAAPRMGPARGDGDDAAAGSAPKGDPMTPPPGGANDAAGRPPSNSGEGGPPGSPGQGGPPSGTPGKGGPPPSSPGQGGPPSRTPGKGGPPSSGPVQGGPPSVSPGKGRSPRGTPVESAPPQSPPPKPVTPEPRANPEQRPTPTAPVAPPKPPPGPHARPTPGPP